MTSSLIIVYAINVKLKFLVRTERTMNIYKLAEVELHIL